MPRTKFSEETFTSPVSGVRYLLQKSNGRDRYWNLDTPEAPKPDPKTLLIERLMNNNPLTSDERSRWERLYQSPSLEGLLTPEETEVRNKLLRESYLENSQGSDLTPNEIQIWQNVMDRFPLNDDGT